jgi:hypothetical protein
VHCKPGPALKSEIILKRSMPQLLLLMVLVLLSVCHVTASTVGTADCGSGTGGPIACDTAGQYCVSDVCRETLAGFYSNASSGV